ncbi:MAG: PAS domain S-box protein, partial [Betaproteobacteria bacterium]|nr:PAS domain S-box protein [Betaproteobacteria bacterium]
MKRSRKIALLELLETLARATNEATSPEVAMRTCLEQISAYASWSLGRVALLKAGSPVPVVQTSLWHGADSPRFAEFVRQSEDYDYTQASGKFASVVLREKRAVWITEFDKADARRRLLTAINAGLHSAFAFPIIVHGEVAAFLEFFATGPRRVDPQLFGAIGSVGAQLARLVERDRAEAAHARLASIVESSQDAIVSTAIDRSILTWNAGAERMFGYQAGEVVGRDVGLLVPDERHHELGQRRAIALAGQQAPPHETERLTKDGRRIPVSISASSLKDGAGNVTGVALIYRDIGELKRIQHDLERKAGLTRLMESLARTANEAASAETAMQSCIRLIAEYGNWTLGGVGTFGQGRAGGIPQTTYWHTADPGRFAHFMHQSRRTDHTATRGHFVGRVLREKGPVWLADLSRLPVSGRILEAAQAGLRSAFTFPVIVSGEVAAFLEFFADEPREPDAPLIEATGSVGAQLARLIERGRAEAVHAQLAAIVENSDDAIVSRDLERRVVTWNAAAERLFGYSAAEVIARDISLIIPPDQAALAAQNRALLVLGQSIPAYDAVRLTRDGRRIDVSITQSPIKDAAGSVVGVSLIFRDITERKQAEEKIRQLAHYDSLTGLPNRALFYDRLGQTIGHARREGYEVALMYIDLDRFKVVNDTLGHDAGDELLKALAVRIRERLRESDTVARIGGDEFVAILPRITTRDDAAKVSRKIIDALCAPFFLGSPKREASIGASIGIAIYPADAQDADSLLKAA